MGGGILRTPGADSNSDINTNNDTFSDPVERVKKTEAFCFSNVRFALQYVDAIVQVANLELAPKKKYVKPKDIVVPILEEIVDCLGGYDNQSFGKDKSDPPKVIWVDKSLSNSSIAGWPKISEFNIKCGAEKLEEYIKTWERSSEWICYVEFLGFESEESANYFVYEVEFSIPTPIYPIPQATASIYFSLEVSKMVPPTHDRCIEVSYVFESSNVIHFPGDIHFQENWIRDIIQCKIQFYRSLTF